MVVETNFPTLFQKLKVEDDTCPYLPPATWESIRSQNGNRLFPTSASPPQQPVSLGSSVSEASLVRLALNALQGMQSALLSIEKLSAAFCSDPADRTYHRTPSLWNRSSSAHALGKILKSIGCSGFLVFLLHKFVDYFSELNLDKLSPEKKVADSEFSSNQNCCETDMCKEHPSHSLVNQAFAVALGKVLQGYISALHTLCASLAFRHSSKSLDEPLNSSFDQACLKSVVHSEITLLDVYLHTKELRTQIEALGNICNLHNIAICFTVSSFEEITAKADIEFSKFYRGGDLLSYLYSEIEVADPAHLALLKFLFLHSCEPYCRFIRSWMFEAEIVDPYQEFIVEYPTKEHFPLFCQAGIPFNFTLAHTRERVAVPCFLRDFLVPIIRAGQQVQVLQRLLELCICVVSGDYTYKDFLPNWSVYIGNHLLSASPLSFSKGYLEAMSNVREQYYGKLQEKIEVLLAKLEVVHDQVLPPSSVLIFDSEQSLKTAVSLTFNAGQSIPSLADEWKSNALVKDMSSGPLSAEDESYISDTYESWESPSLKDFEDQREDEQPTSFPVALMAEECYSSSLSFITNKKTGDALLKPIQRQEKIECDNLKKCEKLDNSRCLMTSHPKTSTFSHMFEPLFGKSNLSSFSSGRNDECWPVSHLPTLYDGELFQFYEASHQCQVSNGYSEENQPYSSKMASSTSTLEEEVLITNQLEKVNYTVNLSTLQEWMVKCSGNFLSRNPMLRKNPCFHPGKNPGDKHSMAYGHSLPCFDFSCVVDPCEVSIDNLAARLRHRSQSQIPSYLADSAASGKNPDNHGPGYGVESIQIEASCLSHMESSLELKKHNQESAARYIDGGGGWETLLGNFSIVEDGNIQDHQESMLGMSEIPLDFVIEKCLLQEISLQYKYVSKLAIKLLVEGFDLQGHLLALRRYYFMDFADWAELFIMSLWHNKWHVAEADHRVSEIQSFLHLSIQRSSCEQDPKKDLLFVYIKGHDIMPLQTSPIGIHSFDFLGLGYRANWPISLVLTPSALEIYADIFSFLIQVKLAVFSVTDIWNLLKNLRHSITQHHHSQVCKRELDLFNLLMKIRHQLNHFISALQQYVLSQLSHVLWCRFCHSLKSKVKDMMDLESVHMEYLTNALQICFLSEEMRTVASNIEGILQCALDFRYCLINSMLDVRLDQGDFAGTLSRINMSRVISIKHKFEENLKELHLSYLKSPKHGDYGLSYFWRYLNYNEYYSDN